MLIGFFSFGFDFSLFNPRSEEWWYHKSRSIKSACAIHLLASRPVISSCPLRRNEREKLPENALRIGNKQMA